jgi:GMP synthase (glutamine-hydrolysing)
MKVLATVHLASEGPGTLGSYLESVGVELVPVLLYAGEHLPENANGFDAIVSMGGPMNVYQEEEYPFLAEETTFLRNAINANVPVLGVCLGAQLIAKAAGAKVALAAAKEVGWCRVSLTDAGREDTLFRGLPETLEVLQWHEDMFHVPEGGQLLASSEACPNQAFRYRNALGLQFHLEITDEILKDWFRATPELPPMIARYEELQPEFGNQAETMYKNFLNLIQYR